jgi:hypothetical protein
MGVTINHFLVVPQRLLAACDKITSEMRGLSPQDQSVDSQQSENTQTHIRNIHNHD